MRFSHIAVIAAALTTSVVPMFGQGSALSIPPTTSSYALVSQTFVTRSQSYYTYRAVLVNTGPAVSAVSATVSSLSPFVTAVAGQGTLHFSPVPANSVVTSTDSFTVLINGGFPFDPSEITWSFNGPSSNPGPNQTVPELTTVTLNGGASTNPGGIGSLTYSWAIQTAPPGSIAALATPNNVIATFQPDVVGTWVIALTVSNGSQSDTATVTISTTDVPPTANAGPNQTVAVGSTVTLNGTKSSDANGRPLTYLWSFVSTPSTSTSVIYNLRSPVATFLLDQPGSYIVGLVVNDGTQRSALATVTITTGNTPPIAVATATPQNAAVNGLVQLDGSRSTDADGNPLKYQWSLNTTQAPGSKATLSNPNIVNPTFTADVAGTYVAQLIVTDGTIASQPATATITTNTVLPPQANAGPNQTVVAGSRVQLQGSGTDPASLPLTYIWSLPTIPPGSRASLSATNIPNPTFVADLPGTYMAQLTVFNGSVSSSPATVMITSTFGRPVAVPTTSTPSVPVGTIALLSGFSSYDPNSVAITGYAWSLSVPPGSSAALIGANTEFPRFVADVAGTYVAQLIVQDAFGSSAPATVPVSAGGMTITMTPSPLNLSTSQEPMTITISPGAATEPVRITLSGYDPSIAFPASNTVIVPVSSSSANVLVTPITPGTTSITANAPGYQASTVPVVVSTPRISVTFDGNATSVALNQSIGGTITLSAPSPPGGTSVTLVDVQDHDAGEVPGLVTFSPTAVYIPAGSTTGRFAMTGALAGPIEILPGAPGYQRVNFLVFTVTSN